MNPHVIERTNEQFPDGMNWFGKFAIRLVSILFLIPLECLYLRISLFASLARKEDVTDWIRNWNLSDYTCIFVFLAIMYAWVVATEKVIAWLSGE